MGLMRMLWCVLGHSWRCCRSAACVVVCSRTQLEVL